MSIVGKVMMGLVLAAMIGSADQALARGNDNNRRIEKNGKGRNEQARGGHDNGRYEQNRRGSRTYGYYGHNVYTERYYPPPPVIFAPPPLPGIEIIFPPIFFHN